MKASVAAALGASTGGIASAADEDTASAPMVKGELTRFATTAFGAEVTGPFVFDDGTFLFSLQHPDDGDRNAPAFRKGAIGYVRGYRFGDDDAFEELSIPTTAREQGQVRTAAGSYEILAREQQYIDGGAQRLGVPLTPGGVPVDQYAGSKYSSFGNDPDMNQFVATPEGEYDGYLYTNFEQSPGTLSRMPLTFEDGELEPDLDATTNLANHDALRELGGTRINCYGDLSPWGTPLSAEEEYSHPRVSTTATVSEMVEESGVGRRGAAAFYNRPNPADVAGAISEYYGDDAWYPQGAFALAGLELLAYYLGAAPVDQDGDANTTTPIEGPYPNRYRYGYIVDFRDPAAEDPDDVAPVKYYVMGRAAWEAPDVQRDRKTVYLTSDGANKGIYKFVADRPIQSFRDPDDVSGTLYAPLVANAAAAKNNPPGSVDLELEWLELGSASNGEVEAWITEYDGVDQVDYLETHAETDWKEDLEAALEEADRAVAESGNQDYITDQEVLDWAAQYESNGPGGVDDALRRVPFLEPRAAAKEIGATIEFRKAEGIDSVDGAGPGDYVYVGLSEVNDGLADDEGDVQLDRVDGGLVYRAELEPDYNVSTLEPVIVGPDATDPASVADDALLNIDNVYVLDDGRVLCCEDADQLGRSYPNDGLYVFTPEERGPLGEKDGRGDDGEDEDAGEGRENGEGNEGGDDENGTDGAGGSGDEGEDQDDAGNGAEGEDDGEDDE